MLALASPTRADDALPEPARAAALLREGRRLVAEGRFDEACPKLVAAQKLQPTTDGAIEIGDCFEKAAKAAFAEARTLARRAADDAEQRIAHLEHPSPATAPIEAAPPAAVPAPADPLSTPGPIAEEPLAESSVTPPPAPPPALPPPPAVTSKPWGAHRVASVVVGSAGVVALGVGAVFGVKALTGKNASNDGPCDAADYCDATGRGLRAEAIRAGNVATATLFAGGAAVASGLSLFFTAPVTAPEGRAGAGLTLGPGALHLTGRW
jgi:hypothetical protein